MANEIKILIKEKIINIQSQFNAALTVINFQQSESIQSYIDDLITETSTPVYSNIDSVKNAYADVINAIFTYPIIGAFFDITKEKNELILLAQQYRLDVADDVESYVIYNDVMSLVYDIEASFNYLCSMSDAKSKEKLYLADSIFAEYMSAVISEKNDEFLVIANDSIISKKITEQNNLKTLQSEAAAIVETLTGLQNELNSLLQTDIPEDLVEALEVTAAKLGIERQKLNDLQNQLNNLRADLSGTVRKINTYNALELEPEFETWCADYTTDASGEVAIIEVPGEPTRTVIAPQARAWTPADGQVLAREVMTGPQAYFNAAILPGWQKFKPTYRRATIDTVDTDNDTANVTLIDDRSSASNLNINQSPTLSNVPIVYDCGSGVFEPGDECVVQFTNQDWSSPQIIGFMREPKECNVYVIFAMSHLDITELEVGPYTIIPPPFFWQYFTPDPEEVPPFPDCGFSPRYDLDYFGNGYRPTGTYRIGALFGFYLGYKTRTFRTWGDYTQDKSALTAQSINEILNKATSQLIVSQNFAHGPISFPTQTVINNCAGGEYQVPTFQPAACRYEVTFTSSSIDLLLVGPLREHGYWVLTKNWEDKPGDSARLSASYQIFNDPRPDYNWISFQLSLDQFPIYFGKYPPKKIVNSFSAFPQSAGAYFVVEYDRRILDGQ